MPRIGPASNLSHIIAPWITQTNYTHTQPHTAIVITHTHSLVTAAGAAVSAGRRCACPMLSAAWLLKQRRTCSWVSTPSLQAPPWPSPSSSWRRTTRASWTMSRSSSGALAEHHTSRNPAAACHWDTSHTVQPCLTAQRDRSQCLKQQLFVCCQAHTIFLASLAQVLPSFGCW